MLENTLYATFWSLEIFHVCKCGCRTTTRSFDFTWPSFVILNVVSGGVIYLKSKYVKRFKKMRNNSLIIIEAHVLFDVFAVSSLLWTSTAIVTFFILWQIDTFWF